MKKKSTFINIISILSLIILIISFLIFLYSALNIKNISSIKKENKLLSDELKNKNIEETEVEQNYTKLKENLKDIEKEFSAKYGYDINQKEEEILNKNIDLLQNENISILKQIEIELSKYSDFYSGEYYTSDSFIDLLNDFTGLTSLKSTESMSTDLYNSISISNFIKDASSTGTIKYLSSLNKNTKENDILLFATAMYSENLYIANLNNKVTKEDIDEIYAEVVNLHDLYQSLENVYFNTGDLSSYRLLNLKNDLSTLVKKYHENTGIIEILAKAGENNEKN